MGKKHRIGPSLLSKEITQKITDGINGMGMEFDEAAYNAIKICGLSRTPFPTYSSSGDIGNPYLFDDEVWGSVSRPGREVYFKIQYMKKTMVLSIYLDVPTPMKLTHEFPINASKGRKADREIVTQWLKDNWKEIYDEFISIYRMNLRTAMLQLAIEI